MITLRQRLAVSLASGAGLREGRGHPGHGGTGKDHSSAWQGPEVPRVLGSPLQVPGQGTTRLPRSPREALPPGRQGADFTVPKSLQNS